MREYAGEKSFERQIINQREADQGHRARTALQGERVISL